MRTLPATVVTSLLHARLPALYAPRSAIPKLVVAEDVTYSALYDFTGTDKPMDKWERIDDVIMGGVSSSRLTPAADGSCAVFEGRVRSDGGGFCGQRMKLLAEPIDLSSSEGIFVECAADTEVGPDPSKRVWKMALRTKQDRGEVVYQRMFEPPVGERGVVKLPFSEFRLVRGPRLVPGVPPLSPEQTNATFQMSLVVSKFTVSESGAAMPEFEEGAFALRLYKVGAYAASTSAAPAVQLPRALTQAEQTSAAPLPIRVLRPLLSVLFGEEVRRRAAATRILEKRGTTRLQRLKLAWAWRVAAAGGVVGAARRTGTVAVQGGAAAALSLPIKLLFRTLVLVSRALKALKGVAGGRGGGAAATATAASAA